MKSPLFILLALAFTACTPSPPTWKSAQNDLERWHIKGPVKTVKDMYRTLADQAIEDLPDETNEFDASGTRVALRGATSTTSFTPLEDGRRRMETRIKGESGINNVKLIEQSFDDLGYPHVMRMLNEDGTLIFTQTVTRDPTGIKMVSEHFPGTPHAATLSIHNRFDAKFNVIHRETTMSDGKTVTWDYNWKSFDRYGNGLEAHIRVDGAPSPSMIHTREFTYQR